MSGNLTGDVVDDLNLLSLGRGVGQATISGLCKANDTVGLANLEDYTGNNIVDVKFLLGVGQVTAATSAQDRYVKFRMAIERCTINFDVDQPFVVVSLSGRTTSSFGGNTSPVTEATA